ncbi:MAG: methyltransferase domain-containing protein [Chitinophagaceae bacterium]|nr:methyltransferase domain-containing protein [Chitinophagaceae bacterium]
MEQNIYEKKGDYLEKTQPGMQDSPWKATQILKMIERNKLQPKSVVEIGCGAGEILNQLHQRLADKTIEFSGYEIAPDAFKLCLERKKERLQFYREDLLQTQNNYDLMLMIDVFEHVDDYIGFIKSAAKINVYYLSYSDGYVGLWHSYQLPDSGPQAGGAPASFYERHRTGNINLIAAGDR